MKKFITFIVMAIAFAIPLSAQTDITVGDETSTSVVKAPIEFYYENSYSQVIYLSSELQAGLITEISYYQSTLSGSYSSQIYMGETSQENFTVEGWGIPVSVNAVPSSDLSLVYDGVVPLQQGWVTITLTTPFNYTGTGNLVVGYLSNRGNYEDDANGGVFKATQTSDTKAFVAYSDDMTLGLDNAWYEVSGLNKRPNTKFMIISSMEDYCPPVQNIQVNSITATSAEITWTADPTAVSFEVEYRETGSEAWMLAATNITANSCSLS